MLTRISISNGSRNLLLLLRARVTAKRKLANAVKKLKLILSLLAALQLKINSKNKLVRLLETLKKQELMCGCLQEIKLKQQLILARAASSLQKIKIG
jgi:hypothetical protein